MKEKIRNCRMPKEILYKSAQRYLLSLSNRFTLDQISLLKAMIKQLMSMIGKRNAANTSFADFLAEHNKSMEE